MVARCGPLGAAVRSDQRRSTVPRDRPAHPSVRRPGATHAGRRRSSTSTRSCASWSPTWSRRCRTQGGAGLAAPQLGVGLRVFAFDVDEVVGHIDQPGARLPRRRGAGRPGGLPVDPGDLRRHQAPAERRGHRLQRVRRPDPAGRHRPDGALRAARDRPPRRGALPRPARRGRPQGRDEGRSARPSGTTPARRRWSRPARTPRGSSAWAGEPMRLVFAGTPAVALPALDAHRRLRPRAGRRGHPPGRAGRPGPQPGPVAGRRLGRRARHRGAHPAAAARARVPGAAARARAGLRAGGRLRRAGAAGRAGDPRHGWVNLHFSLLPAWRGAAPVQHAVLHGDEVTGASVFELEAGLDTGPVYGTLTEEIRPTDTSGDLLERLADRGRRAARRGARRDRGRHRAGRAAAGRRRLAWRRSSPSRTPGCAGTTRRSRSTGGSGPARPAPGAWTTFRDDRVKLGPVRPVANAARLKPGDLLVERTRVLVGTATTPVALGEVRAAGKKPMPAADWARGVRVDGRGALRSDDRPRSGRSGRRRREPAPRAGPPGGDRRRSPRGGRPPSTRPGRRPTRRSPRCTATTRTPTWSCRRSCARRGCTAGTPRSPPS